MVPMKFKCPKAACGCDWEVEYDPRVATIYIQCHLEDFHPVSGCDWEVEYV